MVTKDDAGTISRFARRRGISMPLLADADGAIIRAFGVMSRMYPEGSAFHGIAHPVILVVDTAGIVRHRFSSEDPYARPEAETVLGAIGR